VRRKLTSPHQHPESCFRDAVQPTRSLADRTDWWRQPNTSSTGGRRHSVDVGSFHYAGGAGLSPLAPVFEPPTSPAAGGGASDAAAQLTVAQSAAAAATVLRGSADGGVAGSVAAGGTGGGGADAGGGHHADAQRTSSGEASGSEKSDDTSLSHDMEARAATIGVVGSIVQGIAGIPRNRSIAALSDLPGLRKRFLLWCIDYRTSDAVSAGPLASAGFTGY